MGARHVQGEGALCICEAVLHRLDSKFVWKWGQGTRFLVSNVSVLIWPAGLVRLFCLDTQGLRDPFADHSTPKEYVQYHEKVWATVPADYTTESHMAPDGAAVRGARV